MPVQKPNLLPFLLSGRHTDLADGRQTLSISSALQLPEPPTPPSPGDPAAPQWCSLEWTSDLGLLGCKGTCPGSQGVLGSVGWPVEALPLQSLDLPLSLDCAPVAHISDGERVTRTPAFQSWLCHQTCLLPPLGLGFFTHERERLVQWTLKSPSNDPSDVTLKGAVAERYLR